MRLLGLLFICVLLAGCVPEPEGKGMITSLKEGQDTSALIGNVISGDYGAESCSADPDCSLGFRCENSTCVPKTR